MKQSIARFIHLQRLKQLLMTGLSVMDLNQSILRLHQTYKNLFDRFQSSVKSLSPLSIYHYFKMLKDFQPSTGSSYIKRLKELNHQKKNIFD